MKKHALKMFSMILFVVMAFSTNVFAADVNSDHGNFLMKSVITKNQALL